MDKILFYHASWFLLICAIKISYQLSTSSHPFPRDIAVPLEDLTDEGVNRYYKGDWHGAINFFEKALVNYKMQQHVQVACHAKCQNTNISKEFHMDFSKYDDLYYFGNLIVQAACIKLCKEEHPYQAVHLGGSRKDIIEDFENRKPYNFLQYAYYKTNSIKKACQAAQTYFTSNLDDEQAFNNLEFYRSMSEVNETFFKDLEESVFVGTFVEGVAAYEKNNHEEAISKIEKSLLQYFLSFDDCQSLCFKPIDHTYFYRLYRAVAEQLLSVVDCSLHCEENLSPIWSNKKLNKFVARCFSYLQFSYHSSGNWAMAVTSAASALLLDPEDPTAQRNMAFYRTEEGSHGLSLDLHFQPRADAVRYYNHLQTIRKLRDINEANFVILDEEEVEEEKETDSLITLLTNEINAQLNQRLRGELNM